MKKKFVKTIKKEEAPFKSIDSTINNSLILCLILSFLFGYLHMRHIETLSENEKHFSHLSNLERELSFRTESALYYYYFKLLTTNNDTILSTTNRFILNDDRTEHPQIINSLQRFNLYSEFVTATLYRLATYFNLLTKNCWKIHRGDNMPSVESCVGYLEPIYFYTKTVFTLNGLSLVFLFILCYQLNNKNILSGILACLCYFYNHGETTRVMWTPALRESFSFPFHLLQMLILTSHLKSNQSSYLKQICFILATVCFILTWQFAQFSLATQLMSLFATYSLGFLTKQKFVSILISHSVSLLICYALMFANRMLITSLYASLLVSLWLLLSFESIIKFKINSILFKILITLSRVLVLIALLFVFKNYVLKLALQNFEDDSHIWDILKSKFNNNLHTFDTRLYTCAKEFDFLEWETLIKLSKTLLLPLSILILIYYGIRYLHFYFTNLNNENDPLIVYNMFQLVAYALMAFMIMRLKLFWVPHLCIFASLLGSVDFTSIKLSNKTKLSMLIVLIAIMSYQGVQNLKEQHNIEGEYSDYALEQVMNWINKNTKLNDSFAGN